MGPLEHAAGGNSRQRTRKLQRRHLDRPLSDAYGDGLARVPLFMLCPQLPGRGGHGASGLVGQIDSSLLPQADFGPVLRDGVDAQLLRERVVVGIAGPRDGVVDVHHAVVVIAGEETAVERAAAVAHHAHVLGNVLFEPGERHDDLEGRAGRELRLDGLVHQGMVGVVDDRRPVTPGEAHGELVGIVGRTRDHGEDFAGMGVHCHQRAVPAFHGLLGNTLEIEVDGEAEVVAGFGQHLAELADLFAVAVDDDIARAVGATQPTVISFFHARFAHHIAGLVKVILGAVQVLLRHFADVADEVRREAVAGVEASLRVPHCEFGQLIAVGLDEGLLIRGNVLLQWDGIVGRRACVAAQGCLDLVHRKIEAAGDEGNICLKVFDLVAQQEAGNRGVVVHEDAALAVEYLAARREHGILADAVGLGEHAVAVRAEDLQAPHPGGEHGEEQHDEVLGRVQLACRDLLIAGVVAFGAGENRHDANPAGSSLRRSAAGDHCPLWVIGAG